MVGELHSSYLEVVMVACNGVGCNLAADKIPRVDDPRLLVMLIMISLNHVGSCSQDYRIEDCNLYRR